jgi:hypothetical protein
MGEGSEVEESQMKKLCLLLVLTCVPSISYAEDYYIAAEVDYTSLEIDTESFNPLMSRLKFGVKAVENKLLKGVGLELVLGQSAADDEIDGFTVDVSEHWGVYSTFTHNLGSADFALNVGYVSTELESQSILLSNEFSETIEGLSYGFSYHQSIEFLPNLGWTFDCTRYFSDDSASMSGCGVGVSYDF